ncbi:MAG: LysR family transcriptional regulator [Burkholderiales bacterium]|nr:LysR family transcriptional regulator [Burkholderiales bacterium]
MNLQQLRHFVALAEAGGFRRAAERLHMTQPPLSASIRRLEEDLGVVLLRRGTAGATLTELGEAVVGEARSALFHLDQMRSIARSINVGASGRLKIGFVGSATFELMPRILPAFSRRFPEIRLEFEESTTERILAGLDESAFDVGFVRCPLARACQSRVEQIEFDTLAVALPLSHPMAAQPAVSLAALAEEPFVAYASRAVPGLHALVLRVCQQAGFVPRVAQEAVQTHMVLSLVESGLGVAIVPSASTRCVAGRVAVRKLSGLAQPAETGIALAYRSDRESPAGRRFREVVMAASAKPGNGTPATTVMPVRHEQAQDADAATS